jgi:poly(beta-D-mannuronate) lyase
MKQRTSMAAAALLVLAGWVSPCAARSERLRSPWDGQAITLTDSAFECPAPPPFSETIDAEGYYIDAHHSIIDPAKKAAEEKATEAPTHFGQWTTRAADKYLQHGSRAAATCVYALLDAAARAKAWSGEMPTGQGHYEQKWLLAGTAIAYLKVRNSGVGTADEDKRIQKWFGQLAHSVIAYVESKEPYPGSDAWNNHRYWSGLAVCAAGIATNNRGEYDWGIGSYKAGVGQIRSDGVLPQELNRAARALHYHLYAVAPLIMIAEMAAANGEDLYSYDHGAIHRLVDLCIAGLQDPSIFGKATGVEQDIGAGPWSGADIGWAVPWNNRFPDPRLAQWIAQAQFTGFWQWGGLPPGSKP